MAVAIVASAGEARFTVPEASAVIVGMVFVLYLLYTELFTLNAICLFCTIVHVITFLLFGLIVFSFAAGYGAPETGSRR